MKFIPLTHVRHDMNYEYDMNHDSALRLFHLIVFGSLCTFSLPCIEKQNSNNLNMHITLWNIFSDISNNKVYERRCLYISNCTLKKLFLIEIFIADETIHDTARL